MKTFNKITIILYKLSFIILSILIIYAIILDIIGIELRDYFSSTFNIISWTFSISMGLLLPYIATTLFSKSTDILIKELFELTEQPLFIEYYSHTSCDMYKIKTNKKYHYKDTLVLCPVSNGINKSLKAAIKYIKFNKVDID